MRTSSSVLVHGFLFFATLLVATPVAGQSEPVMSPELRGDIVSHAAIRRWSPLVPTPEDAVRAEELLQNISASEAIYADVAVSYIMATWTYQAGTIGKGLVSDYGTSDEFGNPVRKCSKTVRWAVSGPQVRLNYSGPCWMRVDGLVRETEPSYRLCFDGETSQVLSDSGLVDGGGDAIANTREGYTPYEYALRPHRIRGSPTSDETLSDFLRGIRRAENGTLQKTATVSTLLALGEQTVDGVACVGLCVQRARDGKVRSEQHYWFAPDLNHLPVRYEAFGPPEPLPYDDIAYGPDVVTRIDRHFQIAPGVWFPGRSRTVRLDRFALAEGTISVAFRKMTEVQEASLNPELDASDCSAPETPDDASWYRVRDGEIVNSEIHCSGGRFHAYSWTRRRKGAVAVDPGRRPAHRSGRSVLEGPPLKQVSRSSVTAGLLAAAGLAFLIAPGETPDGATDPTVRTAAVRVTPERLDLGVGFPGEELRGTFDLRNVSASSVSFKLSRSCSCTTLRPTSGLLPPGGSLRVETSVTLPMASGGQTAARVGVRVDGAAGEAASVEVLGLCPRLFALSDHDVQFGVKDEEPDGEAITVDCEADGLSFEGVDRPIAVATDEYEVAIIEVKAKSARVKIARRPDAAASAVALRVTARTSYGNEVSETFVIRDSTNAGLVVAPRHVRGRGPVTVVARASDGRPIRFRSVDDRNLTVEVINDRDRVVALRVALADGADFPASDVVFRFEDDGGREFLSSVGFSRSE